MFPRNYMSICLYVNSTPETQIHRNTRKLKISTKGPLCGVRVFMCIWVLGVEFIYVDFDMLPKALHIRYNV